MVERQYTGAGAVAAATEYFAQCLMAFDSGKWNEVGTEMCTTVHGVTFMLSAPHQDTVRYKYTGWHPSESLPMRWRRRRRRRRRRGTMVMKANKKNTWKRTSAINHQAVENQMKREKKKQKAQNGREGKEELCSAEQCDTICVCVCVRRLFT